MIVRADGPAREDAVVVEDGLEGTELPACRRLATQLEAPWSCDAQFESDMDRLVKLVESVAGLS